MWGDLDTILWFTFEDLTIPQNWTSQDVRSSQILISFRIWAVHAVQVFWKELLKSISSLRMSVWADQVFNMELSVQTSSLRRPTESDQLSQGTCWIRSFLSEDQLNQISSFEKNPFEQISSYYRVCWTVHQFRANIWCCVPLLDTLLQPM